MNMVTLEEAAQRLRVSRATLYRWSREGRLKLYRLGPRATRIREEDLARMEEGASQVHSHTLLDDANLWRDSREADLGGALLALDSEIPAAELQAYHRELASLGVPVRWDPDSQEFTRVSP